MSIDPRPARPADTSCPSDDHPLAVARTAADVLAIMPHTLGFWPRESVVLLTSSADRPGPCLRLDLPSPEVIRDPAALAAWSLEVTDLLETDVFGDRVFAALFSERLLDGLEPEEDADLVAAVEEAAVLSGHRVADLWLVTDRGWIPVPFSARRSPGPWRDLSEITDSAVWAGMVVGGSVVQERTPQEQEGPRPVTDRPESSCEEVAAAVLRAWPRPHLQPAWDPAWLRDWEEALAGHAAQLGEQRLARLALSLSDPLGVELVLASAASGDPRRAQRASDAWEQVLSGQDDPAAREADQVVEDIRWAVEQLTAQSELPPRWDRLEVLERVLEELMAALEAAVITRRAFERDPVLRMVRAALCAATGHLERFRGRGSWAAHWMERGAELDASNPVVLRAQRIASGWPVPRWAAAGAPRSADLGREPR